MSDLSGQRQSLAKAVNHNNDIALVQSAAIASMQWAAVPVLGALIIGAIRTNAEAAAAALTGDELTGRVVLLGLVSAALLALVAGAAIRRVRLSRILQGPNEISELERNGKVIRIYVRNGTLLRFSVRHNFFSTATPGEVLAALGRIAPQAKISEGL